MNAAEALLEELRQHRLVLVEIRDELRSWRSPAPASECAHPVEAHQDLSSMGEKWIRCRVCKKDVIREGPSS